MGVSIWPALGGEAASRGNSVHARCFLETELFVLFHGILLGARLIFWYLGLDAVGWVVGSVVVVFLGSTGLCPGGEILCCRIVSWTKNFGVALGGRSSVEACEPGAALRLWDMHLGGGRGVCSDTRKGVGPSVVWRTERYPDCGKRGCPLLASRSSSSSPTFAALGGLSGIVSAAGHFLCDIDVPVDGVPEVLWPGLCAFSIAISACIHHCRISSFVLCDCSE